LWDDDKHGALHLWFGANGHVMGYGVSAMHGVAAPWRPVGDHHEIDFLTRSPEEACDEHAPVVPGSIGDKLRLVTESGIQDVASSLAGAQREGYNDGGPCFPEMGWHMMMERYEVSSPAPVYGAPNGLLLAMNLNSYAEQETPSFEYPAPKEGKAVYGWHVYFKDHTSACDGMPTTDVIPAANPDKEHQSDYTCTPYFGNLWVQTLTTVVDVHATGSLCGGTDECTYVHYMGPNKDLGFGTTCVPPAPIDGCHCYHQVTYRAECLELISSQNSSSFVAEAGAFVTEGGYGAVGVLKACEDHVVYNTKVGWAPGPENGKPISCDCSSIQAEVQV
jgi:hypothetical protein